MYLRGRSKVGYVVIYV